MAVAERFGQFVASLRFTDLPPDVQATAHRLILDTIGVALAGASEPGPQTVARLIRQDGGRAAATLIGQGFRATAAQAAWFNGTAAHALDYDDVSLAQRGHPSAVVLPAALAVAESTGATGADLLTAYVAGVEIVVNLARGIGKSHYLSGWHSTATLGTMGAAAACARLLGGDPAQVATAIAIGASMAGGLRCNFGTDTKPLHAGHAARCGVQAAQLALSGLTANPEAIEAPFGVLALFNRGDGSAAAMTDKLATDWGLVTPGVSIKPYPCCFASHHPAAAVLRLRSSHTLTLADVDRIEVTMPPGAATPLIYDRPATGLEGKFSLPYILGAALADGALTFETFTTDMVRRPHLQAFLQSVTRRETEGAEVGGGDRRFADVAVTTRDGRVLTERMEYPPGHPRNPLSDQQVAAKFRDCARRALSAEAVEGALTDLIRLGEVSDLQPLYRRLTGA